MSDNNPLAGISADVLAVMGHQEHREEMAGLPRWKKNQIKRDKQRVKVPIDFTAYPELARKLYEMAERERVGVSNMAAWLIALGLQNYSDPRRTPSKSLKHDFDIVLPNGFDA